MNANDNIVLPAMQIPSFRTAAAIKRGVEKNLLFSVSGGIGDIVCAEPTLRYALDTFRDVKVSLLTYHPELFTHLKFDKVFKYGSDEPNFEDYFELRTLRAPNELQWEFFSHMVTNCVDYPSLSAFRAMIPNRYKPVRLTPSLADFQFVSELFEQHNAGAAVFPEVDKKQRWCVVHAGKHWPSKTFPKRWWNEVLLHLQANSILPVLIGGDLGDNRGVVDVDTAGCLDLRGKLSLMQSVALLKTAGVLVTNDSAPLHLAAAGTAWIGYLATVKHPDFITHWRGPLNDFGWRMENLSLGGFWKTVSCLPNANVEIKLDEVSVDVLNSWLPEPIAVARWVKGKL